MYCDSVRTQRFRCLLAGLSYIVPVALALLDGRSLEAESALPATRLRRVLGERELASVIVPWAEQVDGVAVGKE